MAKNAMPVSKAKTAYGLLSEIRKLILEEPKRYDQGTWGRVGEHAAYYYGKEHVPACGTVGCVAGWVSALKGGPVGAHPGGPYPDDYAAKVLFGYEGDALFCDLAAELFDGHAAGQRDSVEAHAKRGAKHIAKFQKKYAKQLRSKRV